MISLEKYKELLDKGLDANHYVFLGFILNNKQLDGVVPKARLDSIHRTLIRKGMIVEVEDKFILTQEAINLISTQEYNNNNILLCAYSKISIKEVKINEDY